MPSTPPASPPSWPLSPLEVERQASGLAAAGNWAPLCDLVLAHQGPDTRPHSFYYLLIAALASKNQAALRAVLAAAMGHPMLPRLRAELARRLANGGEWAAAMAALLVDPKALTDAEAVPRAAETLARIIARSPDAALRICAGALQARLTGGQATMMVAAPGSSPGHFLGGSVPEGHFPAGTAGRPMPVPLALFRAPEVPEAFEAAQRVLEAEFLASLDAARPARVRRLHDVFVNRLGQVWREGGEIVEAAGRPLPPASLLAMATAPAIPAGIAALETTGYQSWFTGWLPSLFWSLDKALPWLLRDDAPEYQRQSLTLLSAVSRDVAVGDAVRVATLHLADRDLSGLAHWDGYAEGFAKLSGPPEPAGRLYLSTRGSGRRPLAEEDRLEAALAGRGFRCLDLTRHPLAERIALLQGASLVVAPQGPMLSHLLGISTGLAVYELVPVLEGAMSKRFDFARIALLRGHRHAQHLLWQEPKGNVWTVDIPSLVDSIERFAEGV